ncbi:MAG: peptidoglycan DD-metalloendopeptidase family protein [Clostridia bacterium]|nr:peptidoglycan DD-metalloendopeptidase family protein [Clostridia bacterium]MDH7573767.1 peptidoglycan DD-metalloendopeptidase family protein [Clostridia bacterium]
MFSKGMRILMAVLGILVLLTTATGWAGELDELKERQEEVSRQIEQYRRYIAEKQSEIKDLNRQLAELDRKIEQAEDKLAELEQALATAEVELQQAEQALEQAEADLARAEKELAEAQAAYEERVEIFMDRLRSMYKQGSLDYLEVLLGSASFTDFLVRFDLVQKIAEYDAELVRDLEARCRDLEARKADLEVRRQDIAARKADLEARKARIASLKGQTETQKQTLEGHQKEKAALRAQAEEEKRRAERALAAEEEASRKLAAKIRELEGQRGKTPFVGGRFAWPVPGYYSVSSDYGWRIHPILGGRRFHSGIDIPAPTGTRVVAAAEGEVIFSGWYGGYGNAVVISHGGNVTTTYGHLSRISVGEGQQVKQGQEVGRVGNTGLSTGPHLHFDVREGGEPVSPWSYLR